jgi:hypothetical protein
MLLISVDVSDIVSKCVHLSVCISGLKSGSPFKEKYKVKMVNKKLKISSGHHSNACKHE